MAAWSESRKREAELVRERLLDDPWTTNRDYGRLVEEAEDADERAGWQAERDVETELLDAGSESAYDQSRRVPTSREVHMAKQATEVVVRNKAEIAEMLHRAIIADADVSEFYDTEEIQRALAAGILAAETEDDVFGDATLPAWSELLDVPVEVRGVHFNPSNVERGPRVYAVVELTRLDTGETERRHVGGYRPTSQLLWLWQRDKFPYKCLLGEVAAAKSGQSAPLGIKRLAGEPQS